MKLSFIVKILVSIFIILVCFTSLRDIFKGQKNTILECLILFLGAIWFIYLIHPFRLPKFFIAFLIFFISAVLHNIISYLAKAEEPVFFFLSLIALFMSFILAVSSIIQKLKKLLSKS